MNPDPNPEQVVRQWLTEKRDALIRNLAEILDLETGLHDAMIPAGHAGLVAELRDALDVESGLGAITRDPMEETSRSTTDVAIDLNEITELRELVQILISQGPRNRLEFRTHSAKSSYLRSYACGCLYVCVVVLELTTRALDAIEHALSASQDRSFATARAAADARTLISELADLTDRTETFDRGFDASLRHSREIARKLAGVLDAGGTLRIASELARSLAEDLDRLDGALNDFAGADLRNIDLEGMRLEGLRWTSDTQWPPAWVDRIKSDSIQVGPGIHEIRAEEIKLSFFMRGHTSELESLQHWLQEEPQLVGRIATIKRETTKGEAASLGDVLVVSVGSSGVVSMLVRCLKAWLSQRRGSGTSIQIQGKGGNLLEIDVEHIDTKQLETTIKQAMGSIED